MKLYRCSGCGETAFELRAVCRKCLGEEFSEVESGEPETVVSSLLTVTPAGFDDAYTIAVGRIGSAGVLFSVPARSGGKSS